MTNKVEIKYDILSPEGIIKDSKTINLQVSESKNMYTVHRALIKQLNNKRRGNANCRSRSEVQGGGKKPWKQKGTGRARAGSIRSPLWKGGGVIFGPKTKSYTKKLNKKEQQLALRNILYNKKNNTIIIENFDLLSTSTSTKAVVEKIHRLNIKITERLLIIAAKKNSNLYLSTRNIKNIELIAANQINPLSMINAKNIIIETKALDIIKELYNGQK
uniref:ribosomal protein L4 n=1 Tax=Lithothamnion corallioides TaxID=1277934 RepID=UPI0023F4FBEF|nr:ribosomal protein L4 [Lithothamnion corallioides]WEA77069.1 ribosomal protein L4 [Lithothamnion corallioides]